MLDDLHELWQSHGAGLELRQHRPFLSYLGMWVMGDKLLDLLHGRSKLRQERLGKTEIKYDCHHINGKAG